MESTNGQTKKWISATQKGDLSWFDQFYLDNRESFLKWASGEFSLPHEELKDIYQQAVVVLYENLVEGKLLKLNSSIKTYLFGIGKNLLLKRIGKKEMEGRHLNRVKEHWLFQGIEFHDNAQITEHVKLEMKGMKEPCLSILEMFYIDNLNLETITQRLEYRSSDVVKTQKSRCVKNLRTKLSVWWNSQNN